MSAERREASESPVETAAHIIIELTAERERLREALEPADLLRFWLNKLVTEAEVMGEEMDAPVLFPKIEACEHHSLTQFIKRYDEARGALHPDRGGA